MTTQAKIKSIGSDGTEYDIDLYKSAPDKGSVHIATIKHGKQVKIDTFPLYAIKRVKSADVEIRCYAEVFGPDPVVTFTVGNKLLVDVKGAWASNGLTAYPLDPKNKQILIDFIQANFP